MTNAKNSLNSCWPKLDRSFKELEKDNLPQRLISSLPAILIILAYSILLHPFLEQVIIGDPLTGAAVHLASNSFFSFSPPPLLESICHVYGLPPQNANCGASILLAILMLGCFFLIIEIDRRQRLSAFLISIIAITFLALTFGNDPLWLWPLTFVPWYVIALKRSFEGSLLAYLASLIILPAIFTYALAFSTILIIISFVLALRTAAHHHHHRLKYLIIAPIILAITYQLFYFSLQIPDYPPAATVVVNTLSDSAPYSIFGQGISSIDRTGVKEALQGITIASFIFFLLLVISARQRHHQWAWKIYPLTTVVFSCLALDILAGESISLLSPIATLSRIFPFWQTLSFSGLAACALLLIAMVEIFAYERSQPLTRKTLLLTPFWATLATVIFQQTYLQMSPASFIAEKKATASLLAEDSLFTHNIISPSFALLHHLRLIERLPKEPPLDTLEQLDFLPNLKRVISSSQTSGYPLSRLTDGHLVDRWISSTGQQGKEWFILTFDRPLSFSTISLELGDYKTDYPRGIKVIDCQPPEKVIYKDDIWHGHMERTSSGHFYLGNRNNVLINLDETITTDCLKIWQTGATSYDWSITEILLFDHKSLDNVTSHESLPMTEPSDLP